MTVSDTISGVFEFFFGLAFTIIAWYIIPGMLGFLPNDTLKLLFWAGLIIMIFLALVVRPAMKIIGGFQAKEDI